MVVALLRDVQRGLECSLAHLLFHPHHRRRGAALGAGQCEVALIGRAAHGGVGRCGGGRRHRRWWRGILKD